MRIKLLAAMAAVGAFAGCTSISANLDPASYERMSCIELDNATEASAKAISQLAIDRTRTARMSIPQWLFGASATVDAVNERRTAQIEQLQEQQAELQSARRSRC